jgi:hypothetical protein
MKSLRGVLILAPVFLLGAGCAGPDENGRAQSIDQRSYRLGSIGAFAEMVGAGVKKLALSAPMDPAEMDALLQEAERIAGDHDVELYGETDFLVTDLFPSELTDGKQVLLIYRRGTLEEYRALKAEKLRLEESGQYQGAVRVEVARKFGHLLSYTDEKIDALLAEAG